MISFATRRMRLFVPRLVGPSSWGRRERRGASASLTALPSAMLTQVDRLITSRSTLDPIHPGNHAGAPLQSNFTTLGQFSQTVKVAGMSDVCQRVLSPQILPAL